MAEELILIGRVRKPHGVRGEIAITPVAEDAKRFKKLRRIFLRDRSGEIREMRIASIRMAHASVLVMLDGIGNREAADDLTNQEVLIPESERMKLPAGRAYFDQVIGMNVVDNASGETLGTVRDVLDMPAAEVFVLDLDGREHLVTNGGEEVVKIDTKKNELRVKLLEEY